MNFYYLRRINTDQSNTNSISYPDIKFGKGNIHCACENSESRRRFEIVLKSWSDAYIGTRSYIEIPVSCLIKLYGKKHLPIDGFGYGVPRKWDWPGNKQ
jgi:hypothetical protein